MNVTKISLCTVCMDRTHHIRQTLMKNIEDNNSDLAVEFVLLDYNSQDNLESYIKEQCQREIESGRLRYYKTNQPTYFHRTHSRNMAFRLAEGEIICNIDADNFTGKDFSKYVRCLLTKDPLSFLTTIPKTGSPSRRDIAGRICLWKKDFEYLRGYDERIINYGFEDYDLVGRLSQMGLKRIAIRDEEYLHAINHENAERISKEEGHLTLEKMLINHVSPRKSEVIIFFKDGTGMAFRLKNTRFDSSSIQTALHRRRISDEFKVENNRPLKWSEKDGRCLISFDNGISILKVVRDRMWASKTAIFLEVNSERKRSEFFYLYNQMYNKSIMYSNRKNRVLKVNPESYGTGILYKNWNANDKIELL